MPDWWDEQGVPIGGSVAPIERDYVPGGQKTGGSGPVRWDGMTPEEMRIADDEYARVLAGDPTVKNIHAFGGATDARLRNPGPSLEGQTGGAFTGGRPGTAAGGDGGYQPFDAGIMQQILSKYSPTNDGVRQAHAEIERTFGPGTVQLLDHPERLDKFVLPNGQTIDAVVGAGGANPSWGWMVEGAHGGGGGGGGTLGGLSGVGVSPEGRAFADMVMASRGAVGPLLGDPMAGKSITDDPSYQFRFGEGMKALERSAASKGTLLTGGHMKDLARFGQDYASTEYQNSYARRASEQANNYGRLAGLANFMSGEQQNQYGRYLGTAQLGLSATNAAQNLASGYAGNIGSAQMAQGGAQALGTANQANTWGNTISTLGQYGQQWAGSQGGDGNYLDYGRGLY